MRRVRVALSIAVVVTLGVSGVAAAQQPSAPRRTVAAARLHAPTQPVSYEAAPHGRRASELVEWRNPRSTHLKRVVVRYAKGAVAPAGPRSGRRVHLKSRRAHSVRLAQLAPDTRYSVSIFAVDRSGLTSRPAVTRFTTPARPTAGPHGKLVGTITDTDGHRLARAQITAVAQSGWEVRETATNSHGSFVLGLPKGVWEVYASGANATGGNSDATGYSYAVTTGIAIAADRTTARTVALPRGAAATGRLTDTSGRPVYGGSAFATPVPSYVSAGDFAFGIDGGADYGYSARDGRFTLRGLPPGEAFLVCASGEGARVGSVRTDLLSSCTRRSVAAAAGQTATLSPLALPSGTGQVVTGRLQGADGRSIEGYVSLTRAGTELSGYTDGNGSFRIPRVTPGRYRVCGSAFFTSSRTGFAPGCRREPLLVARGKDARVTVSLRPGAAATGTVTGPRGARLAGVQVIVIGGDNGYGSVTDARGQWRVAGMSPGKYSACFDGRAVTRPATGATGACPHATKAFTVRVSRVRSGIDAALHAAAGLSGVVRDTAGNPVANAPVYARRAGSDADEVSDEDDESGATTDSHGRYVLGGLTSARYIVCADPPGAEGGFDDYAIQESCSTSSARATTGSVRPGPDVRIMAPTTVSVRVRDTTGEAVAGVDATLLAPCTDQYCAQTALLPGKHVGVAASATTGSDGAALLSTPKAGHYAVCLYGYFGTTISGGSPTGYADRCHGSSFDVAVQAHGITTVTMTLDAGGSISGTISDTAGKPIAGARLVVPGSAADDVPTYGDKGFDGGYDGGYGGGYDDDELLFPTPDSGSRTGTDGRYSVIGVRPGKWTVCARDDGAGRDRFTGGCAGGTPAAEIPVTASADTHVDLRVRRR